MKIASKLFVIALVFSYFSSLLIGIYYGLSFEVQYKDTEQSITNELFSMSSFDRSIYFAKNNLIVALKNMLLGMFSMGAFAVVYTFSNGFYLGVTIGDCLRYISVETVLKATIPHCSEILGLILFGYLGFLLSIKIFFNKRVLGISGMLALVAFATFFIVVAAFAESYISMS